MAREIIDPEVGMGATLHIGSDRYAATIIAVSRSKRQITVQRDTVRWVNGTGGSEDQETECVPNPKGEVEVYTRRKDGTFREKGRPMHRGLYLTVGDRSPYSDPSF